jgi:hypothetical protein
VSLPKYRAPSTEPEERTQEQGMIHNVHPLDLLLDGLEKSMVSERC